MGETAEDRTAGSSLHRIALPGPNIGQCCCTQRRVIDVVSEALLSSEGHCDCCSSGAHVLERRSGGEVSGLFKLLYKAPERQGQGAATKCDANAHTMR
jgi:hypothetical protein